MFSKRVAKSALESLLYIWGGPLEASAAAEACDITKDEAVECFLELGNEYDQEGRGLMIRRIDDSFQFATRPENVAIKCANEVLKKPFDECTFIVAHMGGGSSIRLYHNGVNIDCVNDDEGNFSPERGGGVSCKDLVNYCFTTDEDAKTVMKKFHGAGGLKAHLGTTDAIEVENMIDAGNEYAKAVYEGMAL